MERFAEKLGRRLQQELPGREAQLLMAPSVRRHYQDAPENASIACVLALFYPKNNQEHIVFIERQSKHPKDQHAGQISLPGGKLEISDPSLAFGALREAEEEVGVIASDIQLLGPLTQLYIPVSNFLVHPFVGFLDYTPQFIPQPSEVRSILETPFSTFLNPQNRKISQIPVSQNIILKDVPYFDVSGTVIWGATAMILSELTQIVENPFQHA